MENAKEDKLRELKALLENVPDSYEDFVFMMYNEAKEDGLEQIFIDYIRSHPDDTTSEISIYMYDNGILRLGDLTLEE